MQAETLAELNVNCSWGSVETCTPEVCVLLFPMILQRTVGKEAAGRGCLVREV